MFSKIKRFNILFKKDNKKNNDTIVSELCGVMASAKVGKDELTNLRTLSKPKNSEAKLMYDVYLDSLEDRLSECEKAAELIMKMVD